ncbi:PAS domain S-box protein [Pararcticibacter amylolyticus]|uniref:histidine kinase n=1 Tax=Pararcticibacter amylolyticus TaxID=2173175 RepID=A0A2U2P9N0_9SPHI|nr:PAS domain S-box protein [Pararcticibacter amylolyticus]PWG78108.1 hypothetical protein DDR33_23865 [Pararcticibacter amylolyticus]
MYNDNAGSIINNLLMQLPSPVALLEEPQHRIRMANSLFLKLVGRSDIIGETIGSVFSGTGLDDFIRVLDDVYKTGKPFSVIEAPFRRDDESEELFFSFTLQPYRSNDGSPGGMFFFIVNVTEQVASRRKLEEANKEITRLFNAVNEGFFSRDIKKGEYIHLSVGCEKIYGYKVEDFYQNPSLWFEVIHPDDKKRVLKDEPLHMQGKQTLTQYRIFHKDGSVKWIEIKVVPKMQNGELVRVEGTINDITERKNADYEIEKAHELSELIMNSLPGIFYAFDNKGRFFYWNKNFETVLGYSGNEIRSRTMIDFIVEEDREKVTEKAKQLQEKGSGGVETCLITRDGTEIPYYLKGKMVSYEGSSMIFGMGVNIADRKKAEQEREKMNADLIQRNIELKQFSYIISHNLRSPITKILGLTSIFETEDNSFNQQLISYIRTEAVNLDNVVKDLNTILWNGAKTRKEEIIFSVELELIKHVLLDEIAESGALISSDFSQCDHLLSIRSFIYSIMFNLVSNAIKYRSPKRRLHLNLRTSIVGNNVCLIVEDNGLGIDLEKHGDAVFGLYNRFHSSDIPGEGKGLNIVKTQAETLGGWVELESQPDTGSRFRVYIPVN